VKNSTQQVYFINYPGAVDTIRFVVHQMDQYVHRSQRSAQNDEEALYYCPPRTVLRTFGETAKEVNIGCANARDRFRRDKRYTYAEYMRAQERNPDTGAFEHYCPWCLKYANNTFDHQGRLTRPVLVPYIVAALGIGELDEILAPIRLLLDSEDLDPETLCIPIDRIGSLFEDAMDKFQTEHRNRHSGGAERVRQCVHVTLTDGTRILAEDTTKEQKSLADKKREYAVVFSCSGMAFPTVLFACHCKQTHAARSYVVESRLRVQRSGSTGRITEGLTPKIREPKHTCDCHDPKQSFENADKLKEHIDKVT
jgi:hypothetical protein